MSGPLSGLMQDDFPLTLQHIRRRMRTCRPEASVVTLDEPGSVSRSTHAEISQRIDRLARALQALGIEPGARVGTFAWNNQRHFELYFGIPCVGAVLHTLNIRLFDEQLVYIVNHAEDDVIFVDHSLVPTIERVAPQMPKVRHFIVMGDGDAGSLPNVLRYEELLDAAGSASSTIRSSTSDRRRRCATRAVRRATRRVSSFAPLDQPALDVRAHKGRPRALAGRSRARRRTDVPRQRVGSAACVRTGRRRPHPPRSDI